MPKVSVLTPIFNVERYLPECLDSLLAQTLDDIEFICINDGSTDFSLDILQEYAARDSRIVIIDKPNSGYGDSMNQGLKRATGEYIGIVESDDFVAPECFEVLYEVAVKNDFPDIVKANYYTFSSGSGAVLMENYRAGLCGHVIHPAQDDMREVILSVPAIWSAIYKRELLEKNAIDFLPTTGASFQDTGFVFKGLFAADSIYLHHDAYLHYRVDNSGSSVKSKEKVYCVNDEFASIEDFAAGHPERSELRALLQKKKFITYLWNYDRLGDEFRKEYLQHIAIEFRCDEAEGLLRKNMYEPEEWQTIHAIMCDPDGYYRRACADARVAAIKNTLLLPRRAAIKAKNMLVKGRDAKGANQPLDSNLIRCEEGDDAPLVSVLIPVYNAEDYLADLMESVLLQTLNDFEVICVDDGSVDASAEMLDNYALMDRRVKVFHISNGGAGPARNYALKQACGRYLCFVDGDDMVEPTMLQKTVLCAEQTGVDIVLFNINRYVDKKKRFESINDAVIKDVIPPDQVLAPSSIQNLYRNMIGYTVNRLYRREFLQGLDLDFPSISAHEDMPFTYVAFSAAKSVYYLNEILYHYRLHEGGSITDISYEGHESMLLALEIFKRELQKRDLWEDFEQSYENYAVYMLYWKYRTIHPECRAAYFDALKNEWIARLSVGQHPDNYYYSKEDLEFLRKVEDSTYVEVLEEELQRLRRLSGFVQYYAAIKTEKVLNRLDRMITK